MIRYEGWIAQDGVDVSWLRELGVGGKMHSQLYVSHCEVPNEETVKRLIAELPGCWSASFTAIDENGKQLPIERQRYWTLGPALAHVRKEMKEREQNPPALFPLEAEEVPWAAALVEALKTLLRGEKGYNPPPPDTPLPKKPPPSPPPK